MQNGKFSYGKTVSADGKPYVRKSIKGFLPHVSFLKQ